MATNREAGKAVICCVGNALRGDEGVGSAVARELRSEIRDGNIIVMDCGSEPQHYAESIFRAKPRKVIVTGALDMGKPPGSVELMDAKAARGLLLKGRRAKLEMLLGYIQGFAESVYFIAIQPRTTELGKGMSPECRNAIRKAKEMALSESLGPG
jgi:hydrogenase maturation protease